MSLPACSSCRVAKNEGPGACASRASGSRRSSRATRRRTTRRDRERGRPPGPRYSDSTVRTRTSRATRCPTRTATSSPAGERLDTAGAKCLDAPHTAQYAATMPIPRLAATASGQEVADALGREGCAVVERLVPPALLDQARAELRPYLDATPLGTDDFMGHRTRWTGGLVARSATCRDLVMHPLVLEAVGGVLGHATSFQLHLTQVIAIGPGEPAQMIHRDQWAFDFFPFPTGYEVQCNTIWAMTDFTEENGATRLAPGSHRLEDRLELSQADTVPAEMAAGSVLFYTGSLYHGA